MANGTLKLYNKLTNTLLVSLDILGTFNIEDNLNDTPSNMKVKVITSNTYREEFEVNTVAYHEDTNSWWVIKSDESSYLTTGEYEHEIQLVEYLEFYAYRHLPNCAFAPNIYNLENMLNRLFSIGKLSIAVIYPNFLDKDKIMPFFSFENFTVANAIKNISRSINAIPKMSINLSGFVPTLTFINRNGIDNAIVNNLNTQFPIAYEKNMNSNDQFTTRSVSNITNAKSSSLVLSPQKGGYKNISVESPQYNPETAVITLPSKIDSIEYMRVFFEVELKLNNEIIFKGYYSDENVFYNELRARLFTSPTRVILFNGSTFNLTNDQYNLLNNIVLSNFPNANQQALLNSTDVIDNGYNSVSERWLKNKMVFKNSFEFNQIDNTVIKERTCSYEKFSNTIKMSKTYREGLTIGSSIVNPESGFVNGYFLIAQNGAIRCYLQLSLNSGSFLFPTKVYTPNALVQVAYYPIADIKVSIDNDNDAQDEKFFNQSGKVIDALSVSKLITSHTNDSVEGTKIRNAKYGKFSYKLFTGTISFSVSPPSSGVLNGDYWYKTDTNVLSLRISGFWVVVESTNGIITPIFAQEENLKFVNTATQQLFISENFLSSILPLGQLVRDSNQLYVVTQRSIDGQIKDNNEYYNVIYTLSRNRIARSENIVADSSVISYKTPDDNLVFRNQLYKDYIELSLENINQDIPYLIWTKMLALSNTLAGTNFDFTVIAKNSFGTTPTTVRYVKNPTIFDLHKAKLVNVNWQSNNILDYRVEDNSSQNPIQTPILYTDDLGKATNFELLFLDNTNLNQAISDYNTPYEASTYNPLVPFTDLTQVPISFYTNDVLAQGRFSIRIQEDTSGGRPYQKDPFEIPVFEYMIQGNDDYNPLGNIVVGNDLFTTLSGNIRYHYIINNSTRFTAENATKLQLENNWTGLNDRRTTIDRSTNTQFDLDLFTNLSTSTRNTSTITNVGFYAVQDGTGVVKFLFGINDYVVSGINDNSNIRVFINNWKI
jgi:hypothetical protein